MSWHNRTIKPGSKGEDVAVIQSILNSQGASPALVVDGKFGAKTEDAVRYFQSTHIGRDGVFLRPDGMVGNHTAWALDNPSGKPQKSGLTPPIGGEELPDHRKLILKYFEIAHKKPTREIPDGSNWGDGVSNILANAGGPRPWCAHAVSEWFRMTTGKYPFGRDHGHVLTLWNVARGKGRTYNGKGKRKPTPGDAFVILYRKNGKLTGSGHTGLVTAIDFDMRTFGTGEGNAGNRVKAGVRSVGDPNLVGFIDLFGDAPAAVQATSVQGANLTYVATR